MRFLLSILSSLFGSLLSKLFPNREKRLEKVLAKAKKEKLEAEHRADLIEIEQTIHERRERIRKKRSKLDRKGKWKDLKDSLSNKIWKK